MQRVFTKILLALYLHIIFITPQWSVCYGQDFPSEEKPRLQLTSIPLIMNKIFAEHVNENKLTTELMKQAIQCYIFQFDPQHVYLLTDEIAPYLDYPQDKLQEAVRQFNNQDYRLFEGINSLFQKAIVRARKVRSYVLNNPKENALLSSVQIQVDIAPNPKPFSQTMEELKDRQIRYFFQCIEREKDEAQTLHRTLTEQELARTANESICDKENNYLYLDREGKPDSTQVKDELFAFHILKAMTAGMDAHSSFLDPTEALDLKRHLEKGSDGVGLMLNEQGHSYIISQLVPKSPAEQSKKIAIGDELIAIDGVDVKHLPYEKVVDMLGGKVGTKVTLDIVKNESNGIGPKERIVLERKLIEMKDGRVDTSYRQFDDGIIGIITLHSFYQSEGSATSEKDVQKAISDLAAKGKIKALILDLRDNRGGFLMQAVKVAGLFIKSGVVVICKYADGSVHYLRDLDPNVYYQGPLIILTSKATASAAEVVTQALKDYGVAIVVGDEQTYGKGTIQMQTVTDEQSNEPSFKITVGKYYSVSGKSTQLGGVKADIIVPSIYSHQKLGEEYLKNALSQDSVSSAFTDTLSDVDVQDKEWYQHFYVPFLQTRSGRYDKILPQLSMLSAKRLKANKEYSSLLDSGWSPTLKTELPQEEIQNQVSNMQLDEAVDIAKDMITLEKKTKDSSETASCK